MGYASKRQTVTRVDLADDYWALVQRINYAGEAEAQRVLISRATLAPGAETVRVGELALGETARRILADNILDWNVDDDLGRTLDISYESVNILDRDDQEACLRAILATNPKFLQLLLLSVDAGRPGPESAPAPLDAEAFTPGSNGSSPATPSPTSASTPA